ncbi:cytochrome P450 monooxygenase [Penicillium macrosclerotiorum]|uniref:cytochrome P450 monooxygenase n=1 Tax=Penicillium macrosclerotiorum TaxID=303699 RepID=UPI0025476BD6|nr:cytochrome P450 monooxygenase [Penicillium macrosclerotiorum]KAJ5669377.1 cytochrome P450 monooxygenase [Penicillium macrosclerotiorum]
MLTRVADNPGYQQILRDEIETSFKLTGSWKVGFLAHTPRLESFTREIFRLYSSELYTTRREVLKPVYIKSLGITLQPGTWLGTPCRAVHLDDEFYQDAATFDPERFYDPISNKVTMKATTTSNIYLPFGSGSALCPGRFIGVQTLQFILAYFIMNYELRSPKEGQKDLKNEKIEAGQLTVNTDVKIHIRKRALQS